MNSATSARPNKSSQLKAKAHQNTQQLINSMMKDSKLTKHQITQIQTALKTKTSLPTQGIAVSRAAEVNNAIYDFKMRYLNSKGDSNIFGKKNYALPRRKPLHTMIQDGSFTVEKFVPRNVNTVNRELEKDKLSTYFEFNGKQNTPQEILDARFNPNKKNPTRSVSKNTRVEKDRFFELIEEIEERNDFLQQMKGLGEGPKYEPLIRPQIASLLQEMKLIDKDRCGELMRIIDFKE